LSVSQALVVNLIAYCSECISALGLSFSVLALGCISCSKLHHGKPVLSAGSRMVTRASGLCVDNNTE